MTVSALTTRDDLIATSEGQVSFTYSFKVLASTDMTVYQNGVLLSSGYTVNNVGDTGGTVDITAGVPVGQIVSLVLAMPLDRTTNYQNSGDFFASDVNADFDKIYIGAIQNENWIDRGLRLQEVEPTIAMTLPLKDNRKGKFLAFDSVTGAPIANSLPEQYNSTAWSTYDFTGNGSTTAFTLGSDPSSENNTQVYIDGVYQQKDGYSVSGVVLTFSAAPPDLSTIEVMVATVLPVSPPLDSAAWSAYNFTGDGSTVAFTLGSTPNSENNTQVYIDGVYQQKDGYNVSGTVLTFSVAPPNLSTIEVMVTTTMASTDVSSLILTDGVTAPATSLGFASIYIDSADGDLKIKFGDGTVKTISTDT